MDDIDDPWTKHYPRLKALAGRGSDHKDPKKDKGTWCVWKMYHEDTELSWDRMKERLLGYAKANGLKWEDKPSVVRILIPWPEGGTQQERGKRKYREKKWGRQFGKHSN
jgi:hypothetical protein